MKQEIPARIIVKDPLPGVLMRVQRGRDELLAPSQEKSGELVFEFSLTADLDGDTPNFLGKYAQGPKGGRFVYVNSGGQAGQTGICWSRRAKLSLTEVSRSQLQSILSQPGARLEVMFDGIGRDGGPTCATVKGIEWKVVRR